jgi:hypothetical protein
MKLLLATISHIPAAEPEQTSLDRVSEFLQSNSENIFWGVAILLIALAIFTNARRKAKKRDRV